LGRLRLLAIDHQYTCVYGRPLVERCANGPVKPVLEVHDALILDDVREQITEER